MGASESPPKVALPKESKQKILAPRLEEFKKELSSKVEAHVRVQEEQLKEFQRGLSSEVAHVRMLEEQLKEFQKGLLLEVRAGRCKRGRAYVRQLVWHRDELQKDLLLKMAQVGVLEEQLKEFQRGLSSEVQELQLQQEELQKELSLKMAQVGVLEEQLKEFQRGLSSEVQELQLQQEELQKELSLKLEEFQKGLSLKEPFQLLEWRDGWWSLKGNRYSAPKPTKGFRKGSLSSDSPAKSSSGDAVEWARKWRRVRSFEANGVQDFVWESDDDKGRFGQTDWESSDNSEVPQCSRVGMQDSEEPKERSCAEIVSGHQRIPSPELQELRIDDSFQCGAPEGDPDYPAKSSSGDAAECARNGSGVRSFEANGVECPRVPDAPYPDVSGGCSRQTGEVQQSDGNTDKTGDLRNGYISLSGDASSNYAGQSGKETYQQSGARGDRNIMPVIWLVMLFFVALLPNVQARPIAPLTAVNGSMECQSTKSGTYDLSNFVLAFIQTVVGIIALVVSIMGFYRQRN